MLRILCTGDSHTWGQGARGVMEQFDPPVVGGELRLVNFVPGSYVNRLRRMVNGETGSYAREWTAQELTALSGARCGRPCAAVGAEGIAVNISGSLARVELGLRAEKSVVRITLDGETVCEENLQTENVYNAYRIRTLHMQEDEHVLGIQAIEGEALVYRVESYGGSCAVVNSGIGSCPVGRMLSDYWKDYVEAVRPDVVLMEAHTINDWLTKDTPAVYKERLTAAIRAAQQMEGRVILMTVSPIGGPQILEGLADQYEAFVEASRQAAIECGAQLCDANLVMKAASLGMSAEETAAYLFDDNWHPNERGHALYAQLLMEALHAGGHLNR